jgi:hypothetical protein
MISKAVRHAINNKLTVLIGMIDMALIEQDNKRMRSFLMSAKKVIHDITAIINHSGDSE